MNTKFDFPHRCSLVFSILLALLCSTMSHAAATNPVPSPPSLVLFKLQPFEEALVALGVPTEQESFALERGLVAYQNTSRPGNLALLARYLKDYPDGPYSLSLRVNLGILYYKNGYFSKAINQWSIAWDSGKSIENVTGRALADRAVGELIRMHARLGHKEDLVALLKQMENRSLTGQATEAVAGAKQGLWLMENEPGVAYLCGPLALRNVALLDSSQSAKAIATIEGYRAGDKGVSLAQVEHLAKSVGMPHRAVFREKKGSIPVPSIVHWKVNHYAAIVGESDSRFHIKDPTFGTDLWIPKEAIDAEGSGYFLIAENQLGESWRRVGKAEADGIYGMGVTSSSNPEETSPDDEKEKSCEENKGMCGYNIHSMLVSLNLEDSPVGYTPAYGPSMWTTLTYNHREASQPAIPNYSNFGPKWTSNWSSYVIDDPANASASVKLIMAGGGSRTYSGYDASTGQYTPERRTHAVFKRVLGSPIKYERRGRDGKKLIFAHSDGASSNPRKVFLTEIVDEFGNAAVLTYDSQNRLTSITDPQGRTTVFTYAVSGNSYLVSSIQDPFGRTATLEYDASGRLWRITDAIGLQSSFGYDSGTTITSMTTPYGTTSFAYAESGTTRSIDITDPLGYTERVEYRQQAPGIPYSDSLAPSGMSIDNRYIYARNTFYWDKHAYQSGAGDYTKAHIKHWFHNKDNFAQAIGVLESEKSPLQRRTWYNTPGSSGFASGTYDAPSKIGRVTESGATQLTQYTYNNFGNVATSIDPAGRERVYTYAPNAIDILEIKQKVSGGTYVVLSTYTYNTQHRPLTHTDMAGQTTMFTWNAAGQLTSVTDPSGGVRTYAYDTLGNLLSVTNPDGNIQSAFTYDSAGRVATMEDALGNELIYVYDNLDRLTRITWPDSSYQEFTWNKLDLVSVRTREGLVTTYGYDANRNKVSETNPAGKTTLFEYYRNGKLKKITTPEGGESLWNRDIESRITSVVDPIGATTSRVYDALGNLKTESSADRGVTQYVYDISDNVQQKTDPRGIVSTYTYDFLNRITNIVFPANTAETVTYSYDSTAGGNFGQGRMTGYANDSGSTQIKYDSRGNVIEEISLIQSTSYTTSYQYDSVSRLKKVTYPSGRIIDYARNLNGRVSGISTKFNAGSPVELVVDNVLYEPWGPIAAISYGNGVIQNNTYDKDYRLTEIQTDAWLPVHFQFSYDSAGNVTAMEDQNMYFDHYYEYDDDNKLVRDENYTGVWERDYDANGNLLERRWADPLSSVDVLTLGYPVSKNTVNSINGASITHDAAGNLSTEGSKSYQYNHAGRWSNLSINGSPFAQMLYDAQGRRVSKVSSGVTLRHQYGLSNLLLGQMRTTTSSSPLISYEYIYLDEMPIALVEITKVDSSIVDLELFHIHNDHLGTPRVVSDGGGYNVWLWSGDAYGAVEPINDADEDDIILTVDLRFPGQVYDADLGTNYNYYRDYDPSLGRYVQSDPIGLEGGLNTYAYVEGNPIRFVDPLGLETLPEATNRAIGIVLGGQRKTGNEHACTVCCPPNNENQCNVSGPNQGDHDSVVFPHCAFNIPTVYVHSHPPGRPTLSPTDTSAASATGVPIIAVEPNGRGSYYAPGSGSMQHFGHGQ